MPFEPVSAVKVREAVEVNSSKTTASRKDGKKIGNNRKEKGNKKIKTLVNLKIESLYSKFFFESLTKDHSFIEGNLTV